MPRIMSLLISDSLSISCTRGLTLSFANLATNLKTQNRRGSVKKLVPVSFIICSSSDRAVSG